jgi:predicted DNA-binding protein with PD1-like motif
MKYSQTRPGRVFVIRLEDGDILHEAIEAFAGEHGIRAATVIAVGGIDKGSKLIVGPEGDGRVSPVIPMELVLTDVREVTGTGTLFPDESGTPILHMHLACGRNDHTVTGCSRHGVRVWHVLEVILTELVDCTAIRALDPATGFKLMRP